MEVFYNSVTAKMIQDGVADLHCRCDHYLADEMFPIISGLRITTKYGQDFCLSPRANLAISTKFAYLYIDKSGFLKLMNYE